MGKTRTIRREELCWPEEEEAARGRAMNELARELVRILKGGMTYEVRFHEEVVVRDETPGKKRDKLVVVMSYRHKGQGEDQINGSGCIGTSTDTTPSGGYSGRDEMIREDRELEGPVAGLTDEEYRLSRAAPDLLAACEAFVEWGSKSWYPGKDDDLTKVFSSTRAAVARARTERTVP